MRKSYGRAMTAEQVKKRGGKTVCWDEPLTKILKVMLDAVNAMPSKASRS